MRFTTILTAAAALLATVPACSKRKAQGGSVSVDGVVTGSVQRVWDQAGVAPGAIPVVGWGNSLDTTKAVMAGYVNAGMWQDPQATSYVCLSLIAMEASGVPVGFDVTVGTLYEKDTAQVYDDIMSGK